MGRGENLSGFQLTRKKEKRGRFLGGLKKDGVFSGR